MFETLLTAVIPVLLPGAGALVSVLVSLVLVWVKNYVKAKTDNILVENALTRISNTTETVVASLGQTVAQGLKEAAADGKLTKDDAAALRDKAYAAVMAQLPEVLKQHAALGVADLNQLIFAKIEQAVGKRPSKTTT